MQDLAYRFSIHCSTVSRIFKKWVLVIMIHTCSATPIAISAYTDLIPTSYVPHALSVN